MFQTFNNLQQMTPILQQHAPFVQNFKINLKDMRSNLSRTLSYVILQSFKSENSINIPILQVHPWDIFQSFTSSLHEYSLRDMFQSFWSFMILIICKSFKKGIPIYHKHSPKYVFQSFNRKSTLQEIYSTLSRITVQGVQT